MKLFRLGYFKTYLLLKKYVGILKLLGITRLFDLFARVLIPGDGKQIRVQFCCETSQFQLLPFSREFHDPFLLEL